MTPHLRAAILHAVISALTALRDRLNHWLYALNRAEQDANFDARCLEDGEPTA